jgi:hypothetical protein
LTEETNRNKKISDSFEQLNSKIDSLIKTSERIFKKQMEILRLLKELIELKRPLEKGFMPDVMALLSLPSSLRKTMFALQKLGEATAEELSMETKRLRAVESAYANQLARIGYIKKRRVSRKIYFYTESL